MDSNKGDKVIILGVNADIGRNICKLFHDDGASIIGTYRNDFPEHDELSQMGNLKLVQCNLTQIDDVKRLAEFIRASDFNWSILFSSVGTSEPIGRFFELDFDEWESSINVNMIAQLRVIHALYPLRNVEQQVNIALLAGGGTNNQFRCYSAYCVAKIGLIKMCELLDDEADDLNIFIVGPGFVKTKTHFETLKAGAKAELNLERVRQFMESESTGTAFEDIYKCLLWSISVGREVAGGRNLSVVHDKWGTDLLAEELKHDSNMYKLRRYKNDQ